MWIEVYDNKKDKVLCQADIDYGPCTVLVKKTKNYPKECTETFGNQYWLDRWLTIRAKNSIEPTYEFDDVVLKKLNLYNRKYLFGRMDEACFLYSLLCNFVSDKDDLCVYPVKTEIVTCMSVDPTYGNIYLWKAREKT